MKKVWEIITSIIASVCFFAELFLLIFVLEHTIKDGYLSKLVIGIIICEFILHCNWINESRGSLFEILMHCIEKNRNNE